MKTAKMLLIWLASLLAGCTLITSCSATGGLEGGVESTFDLGFAKGTLYIKKGKFGIEGEGDKDWCIELCFFDAGGEELSCTAFTADDDGKIVVEGDVPEGAEKWRLTAQKNWGDDSPSQPQVATLGGGPRDLLSTSPQEVWICGGPLADGGSLVCDLYAFLVHGSDVGPAKAAVDAMLDVGIQSPKPDGVDIYQWMHVEAGEAGLVYYLIEDAPLTEATLAWNGVEDYETLGSLATYLTVNGYHVYSDVVPPADIEVPSDPFLPETVTNGFVACFEDALGQQSEPSFSVTVTESR